MDTLELVDSQVDTFSLSQPKGACMSWKAGLAWPGPCLCLTPLTVLDSLSSCPPAAGAVVEAWRTLMFECRAGSP